VLSQLEDRVPLRGRCAISVPIFEREAALLCTQRVASMRPQDSLANAARVLGVDLLPSTAVELPLWKLLPVVCYGGMQAGKKGRVSKMGRKKGKKAKKSAAAKALGPDGEQLLAPCPAPVLLGSPQSPGHPPTALGSATCRGEPARISPRHAVWMERAAGGQGLRV